MKYKKIWFHVYISLTKILFYNYITEPRLDVIRFPL